MTATATNSGFCGFTRSFTDGKPSGPPRDILTGFLTGAGKALGRPVGVAMARDGALLVADDVGNRVWRLRQRTIRCWRDPPGFPDGP